MISFIPFGYANYNHMDYLGKTLTTFSSPESSDIVPDILMLGNSLTYHAPLSKIGWFGDYGIAVTSHRSNDYSHQFLKLLNIPTYKAYVSNIYPLEIDSDPLQRFYR